MESRKSQLQKQIIEAVKAKDIDSYTLLKSQWAHRFGVESLEELEKLDLNQVNQNPGNEYNHKNEQSKDEPFEFEKDTNLKEDQKKEKVITNNTNNLDNSKDIDKKDFIEMKKNEKAPKEDDEINDINFSRELKHSPKVEALLPLPPKPKYSYLRKWLLKRS